MLPSNDPFRPYLKQLLDYNYVPTVAVDGTNVPPPSASPLTFYDSHIDSNLTLKNIVQLPSIPHALSKICDSAIQTFITSGHSFTRQDFRAPREVGRFGDVGTVCRHYLRAVATVGHQFPSKFYLHPSFPLWTSAFEFKTNPSMYDSFLGEGWFQLQYNHSTKKLMVPGELDSILDEATVDKLEDLIQKYPRLAPWQFFAASEEAVTMLQSVSQDTEFLWDMASTKGFRTISYSRRPLDATKGILQAAELKKGVKRSGVRRGGVNRASGDHKVVISASISPPTPPAIRRSYRVNFRHYIQRAWCRAVENDSTFIVFHCGRYERIGIRHRESQTLYLSGLIDPFNIRDPPYRKLHVGLYTAIVKDALERQQRTNALAETVGKTQRAGQKRATDQVDDIETSDSKRQKTIPSLPISVVERSKIYQELSTRRLALVNLHYGPYLSPFPSSFIRVGSSCAPGLFDASFETKATPKTGCTNREYFILTLKESIGSGAVGVVHPAVLEMTLESGEILRHDLVIKLAFSEEQKQKLRHEFLVYSHLAQKQGVMGVVTVHGLFEDPESRTLALLMDTGGRNLRSREKERTGKIEQQVHASDEEYEAFMDALKSIHQAGVHHFDLRADNLLINSTNEVYIIDFHCADFSVEPRKIQHETQVMEDILRGEYSYGAYCGML